MCGIAGMLSLGKALPERGIEPMVAALVHRGPDAEGFFGDAKVQLGSRRLSIVDTVNGEQPLFNEDGSIVAVFNGEIYNYKRLTEDLAAKGHVLHSLCDAEVIVHLYEEYGVQLFDLIDGQFAFVLYDSRRGGVLLGRDRTGICPLYYAEIDGIAYFASEIKAIAAAEGVKLRPSMTGLYEQFVYWSPVQGRTVFEGVYQLPPSSYAWVYGGKGVEVNLYHHFSDYEKYREHQNVEDLRQDIRKTLTQSALDRLMGDSDVKWGFYLSGGLDSTILLKLLKEQGYNDFPTFSIAFRDYRIDESAYQALGLKEHQGEHTKVLVGDEDIIEALPKVLKHCEVPLFKLGAVPMYLLSKAAREKGVKFVLSGEGADEMFYGYDIYKETLFRKYCSLNPDSSIRGEDIRHIVPGGTNPYVLEGYKKYYSSYLENSGDILYSMAPRTGESASILDYFNKENKAVIDLKKIEREIRQQFYGEPQELPLLKKCQAVQMRLLMAGYLLSTQGDRMLLANSVEGRYPFLDRRLIELAYSIPDNLKLCGYEEKHILKETFADIVPAPILKRMKYQYSTPGAALFLKNREHFENYFSKNAFDRYGVFDYSMAQALIKKLKEATPQAQPKITEDMTLIYMITTHMLLEAADKKLA